MGRSLYGSYHAADRKKPGRGAVLLCYPFGHEYIRAHRTYQRLAIKLSESGFNVLRFDYYGCGDSSGNFEQARLNDWLEDIKLALEQLRLRGNSANVFVGGLRLGGALAAISALERNEIEGLILWDPVIDGSKYLGELIQDQARLIGSRHRGFKRLYSNKKVPDEILGFPLTCEMVQDLKALNLMTSPPPHVKNILLFFNDPQNDFEEYFNKLAGEDRQTTIEVVEEQKLWLESPYKALVPARSLDYIVSWTVNNAK